MKSYMRQLDVYKRQSLNSIGRMFVIFSGIVTGIVLPLVRQRLGGWATTVIVLSLLSVVMMIPICLFAKERVIEKERALDEGAEDSYTLRDMAECLRKNKYLLIFFAAPLISSLLNVGANWGLYVARYCLGGEEAASYVSMTVIIPTLIDVYKRQLQHGNEQPESLFIWRRTGMDLLPCGRD